MRVSQTSSQTGASAEASGARKSEKTGASQEQLRARAAREGKDGDATISAKAREFATAKATASGAPETREEKIAELKRRVAEGRYRASNDAVAGKMVDEHLDTLGLG